jgi:endoribonuclease Dicer
MERLELLGDSVLKYAVSCHLFLKFPNKDEGQLSSIRCHMICNATLYKLGIERNVQVNSHYHLAVSRDFVFHGHTEL